MPLYNIIMEHTTLNQMLVKGKDEKQARIRAKHAGLGIVHVEEIKCGKQILDVKRLEGWRE